jgi:phosphatidylserine decarboxylase
VDPADDRVIANACELTPHRIAAEAHALTRFWLRGQPYSLRDLLAGDAAVERFVGGTVYQAFLSAVDYHRWHSPSAGG